MSHSEARPDARESAPHPGWYTPHPPFTHALPTPNGDLSLSTGLQFVLGFVVLAELPLSAWLYILTHVDTRINAAMTQNNRVLVQQIERQKTTIERHEDSLEALRDYAFNLCTAVRRLDQEFSCGSIYYRERTNYLFSRGR